MIVQLKYFWQYCMFKNIYLFGEGLALLELQCEASFVQER